MLCPFNRRQEQQHVFISHREGFKIIFLDIDEWQVAVKSAGEIISRCT